MVLREDNTISVLAQPMDEDGVGKTDVFALDVNQFFLLQSLLDGCDVRRTAKPKLVYRRFMTDLSALTCKYRSDEA